jgi:nucleoid-associated protein EbfC
MRGGMGNIGQLMRQAQQMQENMQKAQAELGELKVTGEAGGGVVKITINGRHEVSRVQIDAGAALDDREMLEDLVMAAMNDAVQKLAATVQQKYASLMGGLQLPPGMKLPF